MAKGRLIDLIDKLSPDLRKAFLAAIDEIRKRVNLSALQRALEAGDIELAVKTIQIERAAFRAFERAIESAYEEGGNFTIDSVGAKEAVADKLYVRFDVKNSRAVKWLNDNAAEFVVGIVYEQKEAVREIISAGVSSGTNPRKIAIDIVGKFDSSSGLRVGGAVGLSRPQIAAVTAATKELESGRFSEYLKRERRDKRFDPLIKRLIEEDGSLTAEQIENLSLRYANRLLILRGETIARTEALSSLHAAQYEALLQLVDSGKIAADQITKTWDATGDERTRDDHMHADGQTVGLYDHFIVGGEAMKYPGDPSASASHVINCRCWLKVNVNWLAGVS